MDRKAPKLITERLFLREITKKDTSLIVAWRSNPKVYPYFLSPHPLTEKEHQEWFENNYCSDENCLFWMAAVKESGKSVGVFGIRRRKDNIFSAEVSYILAPEYQGKGYAREAVEKLIEFSEREWNCREAAAEIHMDNKASLKFVENLGFHRIEKKGDFVLYKRI